MIKTLAARLLGGLVAISPAFAESQAMDFATITSESLQWSLIPGGLGAAFAVVRGDPSKEGIYVIRVRFPAGVMDYPHSHDADRHVTVLEGVWYAGTGAEFDPSAATPLPAGAYMYHPAGGVHWDGAAGDEDAVVQIIGEGPVETTQEHSRSADWVVVKRSVANGQDR